MPNVPKEAMFGGVLVGGDGVNLYCEICFEVVNQGVYFTQPKRLDFWCSNEHYNKVNIDLDGQL